jgi:hypothetical protein
MNRLKSIRGLDATHPVIPLAMIIGADHKIAVSFVVVPANPFTLMLDGMCRAIGLGSRLFSLGQKPTSRHNTMSLDELQRRRGIHFGADDRRQVGFERHIIDDGEAIVTRWLEPQTSAKRLLFFLLPMKVDTDSRLERKAGLRFIYWLENELSRLDSARAGASNCTLATLDSIVTRRKASSGIVFELTREAKRGGFRFFDETNGNDRLLLG